MKLARAKRPIAIIGTLVVLVLIAGAIASLAPRENTQAPVTVEPLPSVPNQIVQHVLVDGETIQYFGTFHDSIAGENGLKTYDSSKLGLSFDYPKNYLLFESTNGTTQSLLIAPEIPIRSEISRSLAGIGGEGPASIIIDVLPKPASFTTLEAWAKENTNVTNFEAIADIPIPTTTPVTVAGLPGIQYSSNYGMFAMDYIIVARGDSVFVFIAEDYTSSDLPTILSSIKWK